MKRRGNAIIIAMLMIAAVGGIAFGIGRLTIVDTANFATYENGMGAFYAAEAGAEEGLLRYKFDKNYTVPFTDWVIGEDSKVYRTNLTLGDTAAEVVDSSSTLPLGSDQVYDLRMGYLGPNGIFENESAEYVPLNQDDETKIDLSQFDRTGDVNLSVRFKGITDQGINGIYTDDYCKAMAQVKLIVKKPVEGIREYKEVLNSSPETCEAYEPKFESSKLLAASGAVGADSSIYEITLNDVITKITTRAGIQVLESTNIELSIKPLYYNAEIKVTPKNGVSTLLTSSDSVPSPYTTITSSGYYGGVKRKIVTNIDRNSGTVYDLFDYVIYKGQ